MAKEIPKRQYDKLAEKWFEAHGYTYKYIKQYPSRTEFEIEKDGIIDRAYISINMMAVDFNKAMNLVGEAFEMKREIIKMKQELKEAQA